jgi:hypothetical protein
VADILQSWVPSFKAHTGLAAHHSHKVLYSFIGDMQVLQPPTSLPFVHKGEEHSMLPPGANLYKLVQPLDAGCALASPGASPAASLDAGDEPQQHQHQEAGGGCGVCPQKQQLTVGDAMLAFMNTPHPIETLGDPRAYGHQGSISRYHNPASYAQALAALTL